MSETRPKRGRPDDTVDDLKSPAAKRQDKRSENLIQRMFAQLDPRDRCKFLFDLVAQGDLQDFQQLHESVLASPKSLTRGDIEESFLAFYVVDRNPLLCAIRLQKWDIVDELLKWVLDLCVVLANEEKSAEELKLTLPCVQEYFLHKLITYSEASAEELESFKDTFKVELLNGPRLFKEELTLNDADKFHSIIGLLEFINSREKKDKQIWKWLLKQRIRIPANFWTQVIDALAVVTNPRDKSGYDLMGYCKIFYNNPVLKEMLDASINECFKRAVVNNCPKPLVDFFYQRLGVAKEPLSLQHAVTYANFTEYKRTLELKLQENPQFTVEVKTAEDNPLYFLNSHLTEDALNLIEFILARQPELLDMSFFQSFIESTLKEIIPVERPTEAIKRIMTKMAEIFQEDEKRREEVVIFIFKECNFLCESKEHQAKKIALIIEPLQSVSVWNATIFHKLFIGVNSEKTPIQSECVIHLLQNSIKHSSDEYNSILVTSALGMLMHVYWTPSKLDYLLSIFSFFTNENVKRNINPATLNTLLQGWCIKIKHAKIQVAVLQQLYLLGANFRIEHEGYSLLHYIYHYLRQLSKHEENLESLKITQFLIDKVDVNLVISEGETIFHIVAEEMYTAKKRKIARPEFQEHEKFFLEHYHVQMVEAQQFVHRRHHPMPHENKQLTHGKDVHIRASQSAINLRDLYLPAEEDEQSKILNEMFTSLVFLRLIPDFQRASLADLQKSPPEFMLVRSMDYTRQFLTHAVLADEKVSPEIAKIAHRSLYLEKTGASTLLWDLPSFTMLCWWKDSLAKHGDLRPDNHVSIKELLISVWKAIHDPKNYPEKDAELAAAIQSIENLFFNTFIKLHREYAYSKKPDPTACPGGIFNDFAVLLEEWHPAVVKAQMIDTTTVLAHFIDFYALKLKDDYEQKLKNDDKESDSVAWETINTDKIPASFVEKHKEEFYQMVAPSIKQGLPKLYVDSLFEDPIEIINIPVKQCVFDIIAKTKLAEKVKLASKDEKEEKTVALLQDFITNFYLDKIAKLPPSEWKSLADHAKKIEAKLPDGTIVSQPRLPAEFVEQYKKECFSIIVGLNPIVSEKGFELCLERGLILSTNNKLRIRLLATPAYSPAMFGGTTLDMPPPDVDATMGLRQ